MRRGTQPRAGGTGPSQYLGDGNRDVNADGHFVTVTLTSLCGNSSIDAPADSGYAEGCDLGAANGASTSCCTSSCALRAPDATCRPSTGVCDTAEVCSGISGICPLDDFATSGVCRTAAGECDVAESCNGLGPDCPADSKKSAGTSCTDDGQACTAD